MKTNVHSEAIPENVLHDIQDKLRSITDALAPYATPLTAAERHGMLKMGEKSLSFVEKCWEYAQNNLQLIPAFMDLDEFSLDFHEAHGLWQAVNLATQATELLSDTQTTSGSEAYQAALVFYSSVKVAAAQDVPGARAVYEELKKRFPGYKRRASGEETASAEDAGGEA